MSASDHMQALATIRSARTLFVLLSLLAPAVHAGSWGLVQFGNVLDSPIAATQPADTADSLSTEVTQAQSSDITVGLIEGLLPIAEFIGRISILLLIGTMLLGVLVCVAGRLGGIHHFVRAFYYAVIVGAMFIPWERVTRADAPVFGVFTTMDTLRDHYEATSGISSDEKIKVLSTEISRRTESEVIDGMRFGAMPVFAMILLLVAGRKFGNGIRAASKDERPDIPMKVV